MASQPSPAHPASPASSASQRQLSPPISAQPSPASQSQPSQPKPVSQLVSPSLSWDGASITKDPILQWYPQLPPFFFHLVPGVPPSLTSPSLLLRWGFHHHRSHKHEGCYREVALGSINKKFKCTNRCNKAKCVEVQWFFHSFHEMSKCF